MKLINAELSNVFIDIDDTLTVDMGDTFIESSIEAIKVASNKVNIFIWSQGGIEYVRDIVLKANIEEFICAVLPKPDLFIDDKSTKEWGGYLKIDKDRPLGWNMLIELAKNLEGNWIEDSPLLREVN